MHIIIQIAFSQHYYIHPIFLQNLLNFKHQINYLVDTSIFSFFASKHSIRKYPKSSLAVHKSKGIHRHIQSVYIFFFRLFSISQFRLLLN